MAIKIQGVSILRDEVISDTYDESTDNLQAIRDEIVVVDSEVGDIQGDVTSIETKVDTIDTEVGVIDGIVDDILEDTNTTIPASLTTIDTEIGVIDGIVDDILEDTSTTIPASLTTIDTEIGVIDGIVDDILLDTGTTLPAQLDSMSGATFDTGTDSLEAIRNAINALGVSDSYKLIDVTAAANAGYTTLGTVAGGPITIQSILVYAASTGQVDLTTCAIKGGAGAAEATDPLTFISDKDAKKANLDTIYEQVAYTGEVYLPVAGKISMDLQGTGATAVDLKVAIRFMSTSLATPGSIT